MTEDTPHKPGDDKPDGKGAGWKRVGIEILESLQDILKVFVVIVVVVVVLFGLLLGYCALIFSL